MPRTIGEMFNEALACKTKEEADAWMLRQLNELQKANPGKSDVEVASIILRNLGYFAGYYDLETAQRIYDLFGAEHPIFGTPANRARLSPEEILQMGIALGQGIAKGKK